MIQDSIQYFSGDNHPYFTWVKSRIDSLSAITDSQFSQHPITETFFQNSNIVISEIPNTVIQYDWIAYLLLGLLFGIALTWYFLPDQLSGIFNFPSDSNSKRSKESGYNSPGFLISFFLFINYLVTFSLFIFLSIKYLVPETINVYSIDLLIIYIIVIIFTFYLFRLIFIRTIGFLFKTQIISKQQQSIYVNVDNLTGITLIPIILLMIYTKVNAFILVGVFVILIIHLYRWYQTFILGKSFAGFSVLHLFMYLCTLESIPLLILIKLLERGFI